jgi:hypothetical protein
MGRHGVSTHVPFQKRRRRMSKDSPEIIISTLIDPRKWEEAITLLHHVVRNLDEGLLKEEIKLFLKENA